MIWLPPPNSDEGTDHRVQFYCKRAILFLSSSKILTPHPPLHPASVYSPPLLRGEDRLAGSIVWKTREIGLPSYSKICTLWDRHCIWYSIGVYCKYCTLWSEVRGEAFPWLKYPESRVWRVYTGSALAVKSVRLILKKEFMYMTKHTRSLTMFLIPDAARSKTITQAHLMVIAE